MTLKTEVRKNPGLVQNDSTLRAIPSMRTYSGEIYPVVVKDAITRWIQYYNTLTQKRIL